MPFRRRVFKLDNNHAAILRALEKCGVWVVDLSGVGRGCADALVMVRQRPASWTFLEIKNPTRDGTKKGGKALSFTPAEKKWIETARRFGVPVSTVTSLEGALQALGLLTVTTLGAPR